MPVSQPAAVTPDDIRQRTFTAWVPTIAVMPAKPEWQGWAPLSLAVVALAAAVGLWRAQQRRSRLPEPVAEPLKKGPPRVFLTPPPIAEPELLSPQDEEALVWGIGHFVTDEPTRRLDLRATVRATAQAAGIPRLLFEQDRHHHEVWLWVDEAAAEADPAVERLAAEVESALRIHGLPVERSLFRGVPDRLTGDSGDEFAPNEVDERRDSALVAILTDGRGLARHYAADDRRKGLDALLRNLSNWPDLAFVDFATGPSELAAILRKHAVARIKPPELAAFLGGGEAPRLHAVLSAEAAWAAACALAPSSVDERFTFALRRHLGLNASPWALRDLRAEAPGPAGRLYWPAAARARRVNWLRTAEGQGENVAPSSVFGRALAFWEESYDRELENQPPKVPANLHLQMERALLRLWRKEEEVVVAIRDLYSLHGGPLHEAVERQLAGLAPLDYGKEEHVRLPWLWAARSDAEQIMLQTMRLGGGMPAASLRQPGRLMAAVGLCVGLAAGAFGVQIHRWWQSEPPRLEDKTPPPGSVSWLSQISDGSWRAFAGAAKSWSRVNATPGDVAEVRWTRAELSCVEEPKAGVEVWRCGVGTVVENSRLSSDIRQSLIVLENPERGPAVESLAQALLDSGSADIVYIVRAPFLEWWNRVPPLDPLRQDQQVLVLTTSSLSHSVRKGERLGWLRAASWKGLETALRFKGRKSVREIWPQLAVLEGDPARLWLRGLETCRAGETIKELSMEFVHVCPDTFVMGAIANDQRASSDEKPAHEVTLSEYWIGKYEVAEAQYHGKGSDNNPVTDVSWFDADAFCKRNGWSLPTEAQWEYAARAGTQTAWSFGDDEKSLGDYAWFEGNSGNGPHPVGTRKPNSWGISDMHGNAWEWAADWYGPYANKPEADPTGPSTGKGRVLRGGAFEGSPGDLRSALRYWDLPSSRFRDIGFRCARVSHRQP